MATHFATDGVSIGGEYVTAKAWVNFDGTTNSGGLCTIRDDFNVSSVSDNGTGNYTVNLTTALPSGTGSSATGGGSAATSGSDNRLVCPTVTSTTTVKIFTGNAAAGSPQDMPVVCTQVFG